MKYYCSLFVCIRLCIIFYIIYCQTFPCLTMYVRLWHRWACFRQSLNKIDYERCEIKLGTRIGGGHYLSVTSGFRFFYFRKWFKPPGQQEVKPTRSGIALPLDQCVRMRKLVETINDDHPALVSTLPCYMQGDHQSQLAAFECRVCCPFLKVAYSLPITSFRNHIAETQTLCLVPRHPAQRLSLFDWIGGLYARFRKGLDTRTPLTDFGGRPACNTIASLPERDNRCLSSRVVFSFARIGPVEEQSHFSSA